MNLETLVKEHANLIYKIANKYSGYYNVEDLFQEGVKGLNKAMNNYDVSSTTKFSTYAFKYILGEIVTYIKSDRNPTLEEVCNFMGVNPSLVVDAINKCEFTISLESALNDEDFTLEQILGIDNTDKIDSLIDLKTELEHLTEEERKLIKLRYFEDYTQSETAN